MGNEINVLISIRSAVICQASFRLRNDYRNEFLEHRRWSEKWSKKAMDKWTLGTFNYFTLSVIIFCGRKKQFVALFWVLSVMNKIQAIDCYEYLCITALLKTLTKNDGNFQPKKGSGKNKIIISGNKRISKKCSNFIKKVIKFRSNFV